jgi:hypothetical protein
MHEMEAGRPRRRRAERPCVMIVVGDIDGPAICRYDTRQNLDQRRFA